MTRAFPGTLIVFEGIDGTGKSTQVERVGQYLLANGSDVIITREPTDGTYGKKIRQLYLNRENVSKTEELELFLADRREHVQTVLLPALQAGKIVLCDRYYLSTAAYQGANGFDPQEILRLNDFAPVPDIAFIFEVSVETSLHRITQGRGDQLNDFEKADSLTQVKKIFSQLDLPFIYRIDAERNIDDIFTHLLSIIDSVIAHPLAEPLE